MPDLNDAIRTVCESESSQMAFERHADVLKRMFANELINRGLDSFEEMIATRRVPARSMLASAMAHGLMIGIEMGTEKENA